MPSWSRRPDVLTETVDGVAVLVTGDGTRLVRLNATGTALWEALGDAGATEDALRQSLLAAWPSLAPDRAAADVSAFLSDLGRQGVVQQAVE